MRTLRWSNYANTSHQHLALISSLGCVNYDMAGAGFFFEMVCHMPVPLANECLVSSDPTSYWA